MRLMTTQADMGTSARYGAKGSPLGIGGTIAVHAVVIGAFLLIPREVIETVWKDPPLRTSNIPILVPPPPEPQDSAKADANMRTSPTDRRPTATDPTVPLPKGDPVITGGGDPGVAIDPGPTIVLPPADPPRPPVLVDPSIDPRALSAFQPDYPGTMIRQGVEGSVTVRVAISAEGRVTGIERIAATDDSFWLATQRHALRKWRFRPATRDGIAVASYKVLTVRFALTDR